MFCNVNSWLIQVKFVLRNKIFDQKKIEQG